MVIKIKGDDKMENQNSTSMDEVFKKKLKANKLKKRIKRIVIILIIIGIYILLKINSPKIEIENEFDYDEAEVSIGDITLSVEGDGVIEANSIYTITPKVTGEILADYFEYGDYVKKGDLLYVIDSKDINASINQANLAVEQSNNSIEQSNISLEQSKLNYDSIKTQMDDLKIYATAEGYIENLKISKGSMVSNMSQICDISEKNAYEVVLEFKSSSSGSLNIGDKVNLFYLDYYTYIEGYISKIVEGTVLKETGAQATNVTIRVDTDGYSIQNAKVEGIINLPDGTSLRSINSAYVKPVASEIVTSNTTGVVKDLIVSEGSYVKNGDLIATLENSNLNNQLDSAEIGIKNAEMTIKNAEVSKKNAQNSLNNTKLQLDNYNITSPISGKVVYKNSKKGDVISSYQKANSNIMATIADVDVLKFDVQIDELDIAKIKVGQEVIITIEALDNKEFKGIVSNINTIGNNVSGTTNYNVTVKLEGNDEIFSGMTVDASILVDSKKDILRVPLSAVRKDNTVYVKSDDPEYQDEDILVPKGYKKIKVEIGLNNKDYIEILSGLSEGEIVLVDKVTESGQFDLEKLRDMVHDN